MWRTYNQGKRNESDPWDWLFERIDEEDRKERIAKKEEREKVIPKQMIPDKIIQNGRATVVIWNDGTKTIVKRAEDEPDSLYNAFVSALAIKMYHSNSAVKKLLKQKTVVQKHG